MMNAALPKKPATVALDLDGLPDLLGYQLRMASVTMYRDYATTTADLDITQKQCATLQLIGANPGVSQVSLAATLDTDRATIMAVIDRLEQRGFVERRRSNQDRRRQDLHLTPEGKSVLSKAMKAIARHEERFTSRFTASELKALVSALQRLQLKA